MSYSLGCISNKEQNISWVANSIDEVRRNINPERIINEYGSTSGFVFYSSNYSPPKTLSKNIYIRQIRNSLDGKLWLVKYLHTPNHRLDANSLFKILGLNSITIKYLFYEETANWWKESFDFRFCPPWNIEEANFIMLGVRDTDQFTLTKIGQSWIKKYGNRGDNSFLFSDRLLELAQKSTLEESIKKVL